MQILEGFMPFKGYQTYYRVIGAEYTEKAPLVLLHGGPGSTHNYFEVLDPLADRTRRALIMYDQLGCGRSFVPDRPDLWNMETWLEELKTLLGWLKLGRVHLLGQSWGGMLLLQYVCSGEKGAESIILSSTLPSSQMWGIEQARMIRELPAEMREAIRAATESGDYSSAAYRAAEDEYMLRHAAGIPGADSPECLRRAARKGREAYMTAWGPNEFTPEGNLKDFDVTAQLKDIVQPALVISGGNDLCTPYIAKYMADRIPNSRWELFRECRHMCFVEANERYMQLLTEWLAERA